MNKQTIDLNIGQLNEVIRVLEVAKSLVKDENNRDTLTQLIKVTDLVNKTTESVSVLIKVIVDER